MIAPAFASVDADGNHEAVHWDRTDAARVFERMPLAPGDAPATDNFPWIVRQQHDLVAMFGKECRHYQARNDNARRRQH
jgi:hypothetical protein